MKTRILYLSYDGMTDALGQSQVIPYLTGLVKKNFSYTLVSFEKKSLFHQRKDHIQLILDQYDIIWEPVIYTKNPPVLSAIFDLYKMNKKVKSILNKTQIDFIHCRSYLPCLVASRIKTRKNIDFIFDMRGFWADERVEGNIWSLSNPVFKIIYSYFKRKEKQFLRRSKRIIVLTQKAKNEILNWKIEDLTSDKIKIIPCCSDFDFFTLQDLENRTAIKNRMAWAENDFVLCYVGSIGTWYLLKEMLHFFKILKGHISQAKFLILTKDDDQRIIELMAQYQISTEDLKVTSVERESMNEYLDGVDLGISFIKSSYSKMASSPTKLAEIWAKGIPIVTNSGVGDVDLFMESDYFGFCIDENDVTIMENLAKSLSQRFEPNPIEIRQGARERFSLEKGVKSYEEVYLSMRFK